jgi:hypothetical protein
MTARSKKSEQTKSPEYSPNPREVAAIKNLEKELAEQAPGLKVSKRGNVHSVGTDHPNDTIGHVLLMEALGTTDWKFLNGFLGQLLDTTSQGGEASEERLNFMLSVIKGIKPRDQVEAMLAAQMAAVHDATMKIFPQLWTADFVPQRDSAERTLNKLMRTFVTQIEALKRYRTGGEQKVTVQHVTVGEGGQAIVGNVTQERREGATTKSATPPLAIEEARTVAMPTIDAPTQAPVPIRASSKRK